MGMWGGVLGSTQTSSQEWIVKIQDSLSYLLNTAIIKIKLNQLMIK